jgi:hypothetical protein
MSDLFEDVKHNCSSNKTEIDTLKRPFEEVVERTSIRREELREHRQEQENMKTDITDLKCRSMKNNLIFTGLFESPREYTEGILREFIKKRIRNRGVHRVWKCTPVRTKRNAGQKTKTDSGEIYLQ